MGRYDHSAVEPRQDRRMRRYGFPSRWDRHVSPSRVDRHVSPSRVDRLSKVYEGTRQLKAFLDRLEATTRKHM